MYKVSTFNELTKGYKQDRLYVDQPTNDTFRISNGHYLVTVNSADVPPQCQFLFTGLEIGGRSTLWRYGTQSLAGGPDLDAICNEKRAQTPVSITGELYQTWESKSPLLRILREDTPGGETPETEPLETQVQEDYLKMIHEICGPLDWKAETAETALYGSNGVLRAILMPMRKD